MTTDRLTDTQEAFREAVAYIEETPRFTVKNSLAHTRDCLRRLGDPQKSFRVIHVAGTNGKGSTCAFLDSVLRHAGRSVGLFTSPHLTDIRERFRINGQDVSGEEFLRAFCDVKELADALAAEGSTRPTYFEMLFLMGMLIFSRAGTELVVLETGLGGRLDATTSIEDPLVCVITSVSLDHTGYLGNTVEEIAGEKAGILVPKVPVVYDACDRRAADVILGRARELGCASFAVSEKDARIYSMSPEGITFSLKSDPAGIRWRIPFSAGYQVMNASLALQTIRVLSDVMPVDTQTVKNGLLYTRWPGRMEQILPGVIVDGAHNKDGVRRFIETAVRYGKDRPLTLLFSAVSDKDYPEMIRRIASELKLSHVVATEVGDCRKVSSGELAGLFEKAGCPDVNAVSDPAEAFRLALEKKSSEGILFCVGSLYLAGIIKKLTDRDNAISAQTTF